MHLCHVTEVSGRNSSCPSARHMLVCLAREVNLPDTDAYASCVAHGIHENFALVPPIFMLFVMKQKRACFCDTSDVCVCAMLPLPLRGSIVATPHASQTSPSYPSPGQPVHAGASPASPPHRPQGPGTQLPTAHPSGSLSSAPSLSPAQRGQRMSPSLDLAVEAAEAEALQHHQRLQSDPYLRFMDGYTSEPVTDRMQEIMVRSVLLGPIRRGSTCSLGAAACCSCAQLAGVAARCCTPEVLCVAAHRRSSASWGCLHTDIRCIYRLRLVC